MTASRLIRLLGLAVVLAPGYPAPVSADSAQPGDLEFTYEEPKSLSGRIYARDSNEGKLLFTFKRVATRSGATLGVEREYRYPDGKPAAREHVVYQGNDLGSYQLEELQIGAAGSAKIRRDLQHPTNGAFDFEYTLDARTRARPKSRTEAFQNDTLIDDMVGPFLAAHWDQLIRGDKVKCRYVVVPRTETVGFVFRKDSESTWHGQKVIIVKMEPSSLIIAALVEPLFFTIESSRPHRVLQYVGRTTPKIEAGGKWKDLDAVTVFDWKP